jgi:hypothetical protein
MAGHAHIGSSRRERLDIGAIFRAYAARFLSAHRLTPAQHEVLVDIANCRTEALGGRTHVCTECGAELIQYNGCCNRHCPKCQYAEQVRWIEAQEQRLLDILYFHLVFPLPPQLRHLASVNPKPIFSLLFKAASQAILEVTKDPAILGGEPGITAVLHTWRRDLAYHPHLHCNVTAGGLSPDGVWIAAGTHLCPTKLLADRYRAAFLRGLRRLRKKDALSFTGRDAELADPKAFDRFVERLGQKTWEVYAERSVDSPEQVIAYLGRYTHRVAIDNSRLVALENDQITFRTRGDSTVTLPVLEFMRRFFQHVLPSNFVKVRHYGLHAPRARSTKWQQAAALLGLRVKPHATSPTPDEPSPDVCPVCGSPNRVTVLIPAMPRWRRYAILRRPPPVATQRPLLQ